MLPGPDYTHLYTLGYGWRKVWSSALRLWICGLLLNLTVRKIPVALKTAAHAWLFQSFSLFHARMILVL